MKVIMILATNDATDQIIEKMNQLDCDGEFDFPFSLRVTDEMDEKDALDMFSQATRFI